MIRNRPGLAPLLLLASLAAACTNYDFAQARLPNGGYDTRKLIADLKASGRTSLSEGFWIPLLHCDITQFGPSKAGEPAGYTLGQMQAYGPLFFAGSMDELYFTAEGEPVGEERDRRWLGWGVLLHGEEERLQTHLGPRTRKEWRVALVLGNDDIRYGPWQADAR